MKLALLAGSVMLGGNLMAQVRSGDILAGVVTGVVARGGSYALKDQGGAGSGRALLAASCIAGVATLAYQSNDHGDWSRATVQLFTAVATYIATMYMVPTTEEKTEKTYDYAHAVVAKASTNK